MRAWKRGIGVGVATLMIATTLSAVTTVGAVSGAGAATSATCPLGALKKATKPVEITIWHWMPRTNDETLQKLTDEFNASQSEVKVKLVNQIDCEATLAKYKAGLSTGDLPDIVQLQETDQQQMIDTQTILPASTCTKADNYSFADFLPRVISYYTVQGTQYADAVQHLRLRVPLQQERVHRRRSGPGQAADHARRGRAPPRRSSRPSGVEAPLGLKVDPSFFEQWTAMTNRLFANNGNGRKSRATTAASTPRPAARSSAGCPAW